MIRKATPQTGLRVEGLDFPSDRPVPDYGSDTPEFQKTIEIHRRSKSTGRGAPFAIRTMAKDGGSYKVSVFPGYVRDLLTKADVNAVVFTMVEYDGVRLDAEEYPEVTMSADDFLYVKYLTEDDGTVKSDPKPELFVSSEDKETIHYQPGDADGGAGTEGEYYIKIGQLRASGDALKWTQIQNSDIEHVHELWTGTNEGGGSGIYKERSGEDDDYKFRTIKGLYGIDDDETDSEVNLNFSAENIGEGEQVYNESNVAGDDVAVQFRSLRSADGGQLNVEAAANGQSIEFRGNRTNGSVTFTCEAAGTSSTIAWQDGLMTTEGDITVDLCCDCNETDAPAPP